MRHLPSSVQRYVAGDTVKRTIRRDVNSRTVEREINYLPARYILAVFITLPEVAAVARIFAPML